MHLFHIKNIYIKCVAAVAAHFFTSSSVCLMNFDKQMCFIFKVFSMQLHLLDKLESFRCGDTTSLVAKNKLNIFKMFQIVYYLEAKNYYGT